MNYLHVVMGLITEAWSILKRSHPLAGLGVLANPICLASAVQGQGIDEPAEKIPFFCLSKAL